MLVSLCVTGFLLVGCGGSSSSSDNDIAEEPYDDPVETPTATIEFPIQQLIPNTVTLNDEGSVLIAASGLSLYTFANDNLGQSSCNGVSGDDPGTTSDANSCAGLWPPLLADSGAVASGKFSLITRDDGTMQWAYESAPLYNFSGDTSQGDTLGDGLDGIWHLARPTPVTTTSINDLQTYVANGVVRSVTSNSGTLESTRLSNDGFSLYTFDADPLDDSACYDLNDGGCINAWPPVLADNGAKANGMLSILSLENGQNQWAYKGKALYLFVGDTQAGDTNGDNVNDVWHLATTEPANYRGTEGSRILSSTGRVNTLAPNQDGELAVNTEDKDQFTLYTFDNDTAGVSNCDASCLANWPALLANEEEVAIGNFSIIERADGNRQWALNQQPLYFFVGDTAIGDTNGDGLGGVWHIINETEPTPDPVPNVMTSVTSVDTALGNVVIANSEVYTLVSSGGNDSVELTDKTGFQLYTFSADTNLVSNCTSDDCKSNWPALLASEADTAQAPFSIFERTDGHRQWAINGNPLYFFAGDTNAGKQNGEAIGNVWWVATPTPTRIFNHDTKGNIIVADSNVLPSQGKTSEQLTDLTLYTFDDDIVGSGESTCFGGCAITWPPLYANSMDEAYGEFTVITRTETDGSETFQWAYRGLPLYFFISDSELGDTLGEYPTWEIARP